MSSLYRSILNAQGSSFASTNSFEFDGSTDFIEVADNSNLSFGNGTTDSPFSISAWVNMTDATTFRIVSKLNQFTPNFAEYIFATSSSDKLLLQLYDNSNSVRRGKASVTALTSYEGQWINVICTYDGRGGTGASAGIKLYINGSLISTTDLTPSGTYIAMNNTSQPLYIGAVLQSATYADGRIDEVAVFNTELSASDVSTIYNSGVPNNLNDLSNPPLSWWRMGEAANYSGGTWTLTDQGSGGNDGTSSTIPAPPAQPSTDVPT